MSTALAYVPAVAHTQRHHPENHRRVDGLLRFFEEQGVLPELTRIDARAADGGLLAKAHSRGLLEEIRLACSQGLSHLDSDTYITERSYDLARLAAGACAELAGLVVTGKVQNGLAIVRPPGHHAEHDRVGGFCLINNVAVATRHVQQLYGVRRVLIVDFDVHHGNGTQDIFYEESETLFVSLHLFHPFFYPGTGSIQETGRGKGRGATLNVPFPPGVGDQGYRRAMEDVIIPKARQFAPELILVSAGFDAHWQDPLARGLLTLEGYAAMCRQLLQLAADVSDGRVLFVLEGGYHVQALRFGLLNTILALLGRDQVLDPIGPAFERERDVTDLLQELQRLHLPK